MPHGAPDHVRLSDNAYSHYKYNHVPGSGWAMIINEHRAVVDIDMVGLFGEVFMLVNNKEAYLRIEIDGREIFELSAGDIFRYYGLYKGALNGIIGSSIYNEIDDKYSAWYNNNWNIYIHEHLLVEIWNFTLNPCQVGMIWTNYATYRG